jgi:hypothetical protein
MLSAISRIARVTNTTLVVSSVGKKSRLLNPRDPRLAVFLFLCHMLLFFASGPRLHDSARRSF